MFRIIYLTNIFAFIYAWYTKNIPLIASIIWATILTNSWKLDNNTISKINSLPDKEDIDKNTQEFISSNKHKLSWFQKSIAIRAFNAGVEYILNKIKH